MIISLSGKKQSGKSSVAKYLVEKYGFIEVSWANPLKEIIGRQLFGLTTEQLYGTTADREKIDQYWNLSPREILQKVGTDLFRIHFMDDFWVRIGVEKIKNEVASGHNVVISDTRFPNELKAIENLGGKTIRMKRPDYISGDYHLSETALDDASFEYDISAISGQLSTVYIVIDSIVSGKGFNAVPPPV